MPDEKSEEKVEETTQKNEEVDYSKELDETVQKLKSSEDARRGYELRHKVEKPEEEVETDEEKADKFAEKVIAKVVPVIQQTVNQSSFDTKLTELSGGNPALRELIKLHFDKSTNPSLPQEDRLDIAFAAANQKVIKKTLSEINVAQKNRQQISNVNQGTSTEEHEKPGSNSLSANQLAELNKRADMFEKTLHWTPAQKKRFIDDAKIKIVTAR